MAWKEERGQMSRLYLILKNNGRTCVLGYDMLKQISMLKTHAPLCMHVCVSGTIAYNSLCWKFQVLNVVN